MDLGSFADLLKDVGVLLTAGYGIAKIAVDLLQKKSTVVAPSQ